jgi:hypothetical protein
MFEYFFTRSLLEHISRGKCVSSEAAIRPINPEMAASTAKELNV